MAAEPSPNAGLMRPTLELGDLRIRFLDGGRLRLDGGAMFGIIPRPLWTRLVQPDDANRIPLSTTVLLIESADRRVLVESGIGPKYDAKERSIFALSDHWLIDSMRRQGIDPASIDTVILTHLHFDHAGGITRLDESGRPGPTFPAAQVFVQREEWEDWKRGHYVMTGTYREENLAPLERAGQLRLVNGEAHVAPGVSVCLLPGHTRCQQGVWIRAAGQTFLHVADMMPTAAHVGLRYNMAYDLDPCRNMKTKERVLAEAAKEGTILVTGQDPLWPTWRALAGPKGFRLERV